MTYSILIFLCFPLYQDNVEEDAAVPESQQPPEQGLRVLRTPVGIVDAVWVWRLNGQLAQLGELLLLCHPDHHTRLHHLGRQLARQRGQGRSQGDNVTPCTTSSAPCGTCFTPSFCSSLQLRCAFPVVSKALISYPFPLLVQAWDFLSDDLCPFIAKSLHPTVSPLASLWNEGFWRQTNLNCSACPTMDSPHDQPESQVPQLKKGK